MSYTICLLQVPIVSPHCTTSGTRVRRGSNSWRLAGQHSHVSHALDFKGFHHATSPHVSLIKARRMTTANFKGTGKYSPTRKFLEEGETEVLTNGSKAKCTIIHLILYFTYFSSGWDNFTSWFWNELYWLLNFEILWHFPKTSSSLLESPWLVCVYYTCSMVSSLLSP